MIPIPSDTSTGPSMAEQLMSCEAPAELRVTRQGAALKLIWADGQELSFSAPYLRDNSQSAGSKKLRLSGMAVPASADLTISALRPIGGYAINIVFSDGYDRGIYPWAFLRELAETPPEGGAQTPLTPEDFLKGN